MGTLEAGLELEAQLVAEGIRATVDVRNAVPPCVLIPPPARRYDLNTGYSVEWRLYCLAPGPGNRDTWHALDELLAQLELVVDVERAEPGSYTLPTDAGTLNVPAYIVTMTGAQ